MPDVRITINGQKYALKCGEDEEDRLRELAAHFDSHVEDLAKELGHIAESRLLILAGIRVCEELFAARGIDQTAVDTALAADLEILADRLATCAEKIETSVDPSSSA